MQCSFHLHLSHFCTRLDLFNFKLIYFKHYSIHRKNIPSMPWKQPSLQQRGLSIVDITIHSCASYRTLPPINCYIFTVIKSKHVNIVMLFLQSFSFYLYYNYQYFPRDTTCSYDGVYVTHQLIYQLLTTIYRNHQEERLWLALDITYHKWF